MAERQFELGDGEILVVHDDGRVRRSPLPSNVDPNVFRNALAAVTLLYGQEGTVPSVEEVARFWNRIPKKTYAKIYALPEFKEALALRGIELDAGSGLTNEQSAAILLLSDPTDRRTLPTKLRQLGVSMPKYQAWMRQPLFSGLLKDRTEQNLGDSVHIAINRLIGNADAGDQRAIEKLLEVSGRHNPAALELQSARQVILRVIEIVLKNVTNPEERKAIMNDLTATSLDVTPPAMILETHEPKE